MTATGNGGRPEIIVVSSHVVRGAVGGRAAVPALEALGFPVWAVPTVTLPWHPGHGPGTRIVASPEQFDALLADLARAPWLGRVGGILSGYLGEAGQAAAVARLVEAAKTANPDLVYLCDPVIGDGARLYVPEETAAAIRDLLLPLADIATPNRFELQWLTGMQAAGIAALAEGASSLPVASVVVTSAPGSHAAAIANLLVADGLRLSAEHTLVEKPPKGPGDLLAALLLGARLEGLQWPEALKRATASVCQVLSRSVGAGADELQLDTLQADILRPTAPVEIRPLGGAVLDLVGNCVIAGVDGCKGGWIAAIAESGRGVRVTVVPRFVDIVDMLPEDAVIAVDMPIGLPDRSGPRGRAAERLLRPLLGARQSSVFSIPSRAAVYAVTQDRFDNEADRRDAHRRACEVARKTSDPPRGVSIQAFGLFPKIRELDQLLIQHPKLRRRVIESHPEAAFWRLNGEVVMSKPKKTKKPANPEGMTERRELLRRHGIPDGLLALTPPKGAGHDDLLDALAMLAVAARHVAGLARPIPDPPDRDGHDIEIAIRS